MKHYHAEFFTNARGEICTASQTDQAGTKAAHRTRRGEPLVYLGSGGSGFTSTRAFAAKVAEAKVFLAEVEARVSAKKCTVEAAQKFVSAKRAKAAKRAAEIADAPFAVLRAEVEKWKFRALAAERGLARIDAAKKTPAAIIDYAMS